MMWLPRPMMQRDPIDTTGLVGISCPGAIPAVIAVFGPTNVPSPIERYRSL